MARKYNHLVRFLESWFADLEDPEKEFSDTERWQVVRAIAQCQVDISLEPLQALPLVIRRALSIATMGEQLLAIMDRADSYRKRAENARGLAGKAPLPSSKPSDVVKADEREKAAQERKEKEKSEADALAAECAQWGAKNGLELYHMQLKAARDGNEVMRQRYPNWKEQIKREKL